MIFFHNQFSLKVKAAAPRMAISGKLETLISKLEIVLG